MSTIRYLLDENIAPLYRRELLHREPSLVVWKVGDRGTRLDLGDQQPSFDAQSLA